MHLKSASVDFDGNFIAEGSIIHPRDGSKHFHPAKQQHLRISRDLRRIIACVASRDKSGFFHAEELGTVIHVPKPLASQVRWALELGAKEPLSLLATHSAGSLASSASTIKHLTQPLSDWRLRIDEVDGDLAVVMSALLYSPHIRDWRSTEQNFWVEQPGARVEARFVINAATRVACFGTNGSRSATNEEEAPAQPPKYDGRCLNLENAPVGSFTQFGVRDGRWVHVYSSSEGPWHSLSVTEHRDVCRTSNGFLSRGNYVWPRLGVQGLSLCSIANALGKEPLRISGGRIAVSLSWPGPEPWSEQASESTLQFSLVPDGLVFEYFLVVEGRPVDGRVVLPWELLILRYPVLASRRVGFLNPAQPFD